MREAVPSLELHTPKGPTQGRALQPKSIEIRMQVGRVEVGSWKSG